MKRWLKRIALGILLLIGVGIVWGWIAHEPLPEGTSPKEADVLAEKMLTALNAEAYKVILEKVRVFKSRPKY